MARIGPKSIVPLTSSIGCQLEHDAPELHFQPTALSKAEVDGLSQAKKDAFHGLNHFYRQLLGATSTKGLHDFLATSGAITFDSRVLTGMPVGSWLRTKS
jgi:hypothetical protein